MYWQLSESTTRSRRAERCRALPRICHPFMRGQFRALCLDFTRLWWICFSSSGIYTGCIRKKEKYSHPHVISYTQRLRTSRSRHFEVCVLLKTVSWMVFALQTRKSQRENELGARLSILSKMREKFVCTIVCGSTSITEYGKQNYDSRSRTWLSFYESHFVLY